MLRHVDDTLPGISRKRRGKHWHYYDANGTRVADAAEIARLNALAVPPAYARVWYCQHPNGHLQAVGYDIKGRKQYRYHADFRSRREAHKYDRCAAFGTALPALRAQVAADLDSRGFGRDRIVASVVRLLDVAHIRVGNETYAQANDSYGATTLQTDHSAVRGDTVRLEYRGKSGKEISVRVTDKALARIVRRCQDLPGQALFQYVGDDGEIRRVGSADVNTYIQEAMGSDFSAKHFRTWAASVIALRTIIESDPGELTLKALLAPVAAALGNTPAISRKSYVHPDLVALVTGGRAARLAGARLPRATRWLSGEERALIAFLS